jgi:hypothetical protein
VLEPTNVQTRSVYHSVFHFFFMSRERPTGRRNIQNSKTGEIRLGRLSAATCTKNNQNLMRHESVHQEANAPQNHLGPLRHVE